jgi:phage gpG-like protein
MANFDIAQFSQLIQSTSDLMQKSKYQGLMSITFQAEADAKINSTKQFIGRRGYTLSGRLLNSIKSRFEKKGDDVAGFVGSYGIPYAAIHEFGGKIDPKNWKYLWMRLPATNLKASPFRRLTPKEFYKLAKKRNSGYYYLHSKRGNVFAMYKEPDTDSDIDATPLFWLRTSVFIPKRPYLRPAVNIAKNNLAPTIKETFLNYLKARKGGLV